MRQKKKPKSNQANKQRNSQNTHSVRTASEEIHVRERTWTPDQTTERRKVNSFDGRGCELRASLSDVYQVGEDQNFPDNQPERRQVIISCQ